MVEEAGVGTEGRGGPGGDHSPTGWCKTTVARAQPDDGARHAAIAIDKAPVDVELRAVRGLTKALSARGAFKVYAGAAEADGAGGVPARADGEQRVLVVGDVLPLELPIGVAHDVNQAIYDTLTPGALTGGAAIAGTGTIDEDGRVGPIGGIQQKIVAAADSGAEIFFVPPRNCESALAVGLDEEEMRLVKAPTMHSAVESLQRYSEDPDVALPKCG